MGQDNGRRRTTLHIHLKIIGVGALGDESPIAATRTGD
jgi:hypothetical protein